MKDLLLGFLLSSAVSAPLWWNKHLRLRVHQKLAELGEK
jgi:hypothetical protein